MSLIKICISKNIVHIQHIEIKAHETLVLCLFFKWKATDGGIFQLNLGSIPCTLIIVTVNLKTSQFVVKAMISQIIIVLSECNLDSAELGWVVHHNRILGIQVCKMKNTLLHYYSISTPGFSSSLIFVLCSKQGLYIGTQNNVDYWNIHSLFKQERTCLENNAFRAVLQWVYWMKQCTLSML